MNAAVREYILKGVFLGLWAYLALLQPEWVVFARVLTWAGGGLALSLVAGALLQLIRGYRPLRNPMGFLMLVILDSSFVIYIGVVGGLGGGLAEKSILEIIEPAAVVAPPPVDPTVLGSFAGGLATTLETPPPPVTTSPLQEYLIAFALGGAVLGFGFYRFTKVRDRFWRIGLAIVIGAALVYLSIYYISDPERLGFNELSQKTFAWLLLLGLPFFYILTFCGEAEESEVEFAALCAGLGIGLYLIRVSSNFPELGDKLIFIVPLLAYFVYVTRFLPRLRVFKHVLRGYGNLSLGKIRQSIVSFGRALQLNPKSQLATQGLWDLHRKVDITKLDEVTIRLLNFDFCLELATGLVIKDTAPNESERADAIRMLDMIERQKPEALSRVDYLRAVTLTHAKEFDEAAGYLARLLDPEVPFQQEVRKTVLYSGWELATRLHPEIVKRLGERELEKPGRRIEAIAAVERQLVKLPGDPSVLELQRTLYAGLTETEFVSAAAMTAPVEFNYEYVEQLGLALINDENPNQRDRGMAFMRIAGRGLPSRGPTIFTTLAEVATKLGRAEEAHGYFDQVKRAGLTVGPRNLPADQRILYLNALQKMSDDAAARGDLQNAVDDMRLVVEGGKEDANSLRRLAELYALNKDPLNALLIVERGLLYAKTDADLLAKRDSYYFSVEPERIAEVKDKVAGWFDPEYCLKKAKQVADQREADLETLDYGIHMIRLAKVMKAESHAVQLTEARLQLRKGERQEGLRMLEDIRAAKKGSGEEEDAWYIATKILGDIYLDELSRPDLAIACYTDYREYQRSGADTIFMLGKAYEAKGDVNAAIKSYGLVTAYQNHPRYWEATEAVRRLKEGGVTG